MKTVLRQFMFFTAIGAIGTAGHYATLVFLVEVLHTPPVTASTFGFIVGAVINYFLNYHLTFHSHKPHRVALTKFLLIAITGAGLNTGLMYLFINLLGLHYFISQLLATGIVLLWNFLFSKYWAFQVKQ